MRLASTGAPKSRWRRIRASISRRSQVEKYPADELRETQNPMLSPTAAEDEYPAMMILNLIFKHYSQHSVSKGGLDARTFSRFMEACPYLLARYFARKLVQFVA
jgi:hypothetical protein